MPAVLLESRSSALRWPDKGRGCTFWTEVPCHLLVASKHDTKPYGWRMSILSVDTAANFCGSRSAIKPSDNRIWTACVARQFNVSTDATAPSLFKIWMSSSVLPWHNTASVSSTCRGADAYKVQWLQTLHGNSCWPTWHWYQFISIDCFAYIALF